MTSERDGILESLKPEPAASIPGPQVWGEKTTVVGEYEAASFHIGGNWGGWVWWVLWFPPATEPERVHPYLPVEYGPREWLFAVSSARAHRQAVEAAREHQQRTSDGWVVVASEDTEPWWSGRPVRTRRQVAVERLGVLCDRAGRGRETERAAFLRQGREPRL